MKARITALFATVVVALSITAVASAATAGWTSYHPGATAGWRFAPNPCVSRGSVKGW